MLYAPGLALVSWVVKFFWRTTDVKSNLHWWMLLLWNLTIPSSLSFTTCNKGCMLDIMIISMMHEKMHTRAWMNSNKIKNFEYNFPSWYSCTTRVHSIVFIFTKKHFNYLLTSWLTISKKEFNFPWNSRSLCVPKFTNSA